jgi:hypothetical protein
LGVIDRSNPGARLIGTEDLLCRCRNCVKVIKETFTIIVKEAAGINSVVVEEIVIIQSSRPHGSQIFLTLLFFDWSIVLCFLLLQGLGQSGGLGCNNSTTCHAVVWVDIVLLCRHIPYNSSEIFCLIIISPLKGG